MVSGDRRFADASALNILMDGVQCLVGDAQVQEAKAAAAHEAGTTPKYLVTVYARGTGEDGPPVPFQDVALTPTCVNIWGNLAWRLSGLGPLRRHLRLAPRSPVRLVREVGQDGRVRLVVEPREEGEGGGGGEGKGRVKRPAKRVEAEDGDTEDEHGLLRGGGGTSSGSGSEEEDGGSEPAAGSDGEASPDGEGTGSDDPDRVPRKGGGQGAWGAGWAQQQKPIPQPQQPGLGVGRGGGWDGAGPSGAVGLGPGGAGDVRLDRAEEGGVEEGRPDKRRRLGIRTERTEEQPAAGQEGEIL